MSYKDFVINDFLDEKFQIAFKEYFKELGIEVKDWIGLFKEINEDKNTQAIVRMENDNVIGFIMFQPIVFESWFFEEKCGFIREFWIANDYRNIGHGSNLINQVESYFKKQEIFRTILTTDTAKDFYLKHGYHLQKSAKAKNGDDVYTKMLNC